MKNSKEFMDWQNDLSYISYTYNINPASEMTHKEDVYKQVFHLTEALPEEIRKLLDQRQGKSLTQFLNDTSETVSALCQMLQLTLSLELIALDEYLALNEDLNEIVNLINKFISQFNDSTEDDKKQPGTEDFAYWMLN